MLSTPEDRPCQRFQAEFGRYCPRAAIRVAANRWASRSIAAAVASGLLVWLTRVPVQGHYLFSWDSVNFALALDEWDLSLHQPHPPGYLGYVLLGRLFRLFVGDTNQALALVSMSAAAVAGVLVWLAVRDLGVRMVAAWLGLALFLSSPLVWLYSVVAEVSSLEMLCALCVALAGLGAYRGRRSDLLVLGLAYAACTITKLPTAILMLPITLAAPRATRAACVAVGTSSVALTLVGLALWDTSVPSLFWEQFWAGTEASRMTAEGTLGLRFLNRNLRDTLQAMLMAGVALIVLLPYAAWRIRATRSINRGWALAWALPFLFTFVFIHIGKPGYLAPLVPLACLVLVVGLSSLRGRRGAAALGVAVGLNIVQFVAVTPLSGPIVGDELRYAEKSAVQRLLTDLNPISFATRATIALQDERVDRLVRAVADRCAEGGVLLVSADGAIDWRRGLYHLPAHHVGSREIHVPSTL